MSLKIKIYTKVDLKLAKSLDNLLDDGSQANFLVRSTDRWIVEYFIESTENSFQYRSAS